MGVTVGRREPLGHIALLAGGRLSIVALLHDDSDNGLGEARLGAYVGLVLPREARLRFRVDLAGEVVPHGIGASADAPIAPWWAVSLTIGVEVGGP